MAEIRKRTPTLWIERLDLWSLAAAMRFLISMRPDQVRCFTQDVVALGALKICARCWGLQTRIGIASYSMGDMSCGSGNLGMRLQYILPLTAQKIREHIGATPEYAAAIGELPGEKTKIYFEKKIAEEIGPFVRMLMIVLWHTTQEPQAAHTFLCRRSILRAQVKQEWLQMGEVELLFCRIPAPFMQDGKTYEHRIPRTLLVPETPRPGAEPRLAVHYAEGLDQDGRSDIFWHTVTEPAGQRVIFYLDSNKRSCLPIPRSDCEKIVQGGATWVCLAPPAIEPQTARTARRIRMPAYRFSQTARPPAHTPLSNWLLKKSLYLRKAIHFWENLYRLFAIRMVVDIGAQTAEALAQSMALDRIGGLRIGVQRSAVTLERFMPFLYYNANHLFFIWGQESLLHQGTSAALARQIISGYPFDRVFQKPQHPAHGLQPRHRDKAFVIALFDNVYGKDFYYSADTIRGFYHAFLEWLLEDTALIVVTKEKKPVFFEDLARNDALFERAAATGRFIRLRDALGRFPSDASHGADMAIGIGISSAVTEAVLTGTRGIHCDLAGHRDHPYYRLGYQTLIFDRLPQLLEALKEYKSDPAGHRKLGDWSNHLDTIDPFRDGLAAQRIRFYISSIITEFDAGMSPPEALRKADAAYAQRWGDRLIFERSGMPFDNHEKDPCATHCSS